jgi:hypothetical protein
LPENAHPQNVCTSNASSFTWWNKGQGYMTRALAQKGVAEWFLIRRTKEDLHQLIAQLNVKRNN